MKQTKARTKELINQRKEYRSSIVGLVKNIVGLEFNDRLDYVLDYIDNYEEYFTLETDENFDWLELKDIFNIDDSCDKHIKIFDLK